jgi:hypothetical protein
LFNNQLFIENILIFCLFHYIEEIQNNISVFPNPAQSQITVTDVQGAVLRLYNTLGQEIVCIRNKQENAIINTSHFPQGLYVLKVEKENAVLTRKIQIMK